MSEFVSPLRAAQRVAALPSLDARLDYFYRIPAAWQQMVATFAVNEIAASIVEMDDIEARRVALSRVPPEWLAATKSHVARLWEVRRLKRVAA